MKISADPDINHALSTFDDYLRAGKTPAIKKDVRLGAYPTKGAAVDMEIQFAHALQRLGLNQELWVFSKYVGAGTGWGVFVGPQKN